MDNRLFSRYELELAIYKTLEHGDEVKIAERLGKGAGLMGQYLDPNNERVSPLYTAAMMLAAMIDINETNGRTALEMFTHFVQRAMPGRGSLCPDTTRARAYREDAEAKLAEASGADLDTCILELEQSIKADSEHLDAMRATKKREIAKDAFRTLQNNGAMKLTTRRAG